MMNNDTNAKWWVMVEGNKGPKFYCGAQNKTDAQKVAKERNEFSEEQGLIYKYSVIPRPKDE